MGILRWLGIALVALVAVLVGTVLIARRMSDGPVGLFPGGELRSGELVSETDVDWSFVPWNEFVELQTVEPLQSRTMGLLQHEGQIYVQAELGYISRRTSGLGRWIQAVIRYFKHWHEDALRDGRVVLRVAGKRYERQAVRVTDPELFATLCSLLDNYAERFLGRPLAKAPPDPDSVWFFRLDPRPPT